MAINTSVNDISNFSKEIRDCVSAQEKSISAIEGAAKQIGKCVENLSKALQNDIKLMDDDLKSAQDALSHNQSRYDYLKTRIDTLTNQMKNSKSSTSTYETQIKQCFKEQEEIGAKNAKINEVIAQINEYKQKYQSFLSSVPKDAASQARSLKDDADRAFHSLDQEVGEIEGSASRAAKYAIEIAGDLSNLGGYSGDYMNRVMKVDSPSSLTAMADRLKATQTKIQTEGDNLLRSANAFASMAQDEVSNSAVNKCREAVKWIEIDYEMLISHGFMIDNLKKAASALRQYEALK